MKKNITKKVNVNFFISRRAFGEILTQFRNITSVEQLVSFKNSKALKSILESDEKVNLDKKMKFIEKLFGKYKNDSKTSFAVQSAILMDIFYLAIVKSDLNKKYDSFVNRLNKRFAVNDPTLLSATELDLVAAVNKVYSL